MNETALSESRTNTLRWISEHMDEIKADNESDDIDIIVPKMCATAIEGTIGLTRDMLEGRKNL